MKKILVLSIIALFFLTGCTLSLFSGKKESTETKTTTFAVIGDNEGVNDEYTRLFGQIAKDPDIEFVLHVGDLVANGGKTEIDEFLKYQQMFNLQVPFYAIPGNHDTYDDPDRTAFVEAFGVIPRSIDFEQVHLVLLDNAERKVGFTDAELDWLEKDLQSAAGKKIILAYHRPFNYPFAATFGDDETKTSRASNEKFQAMISNYSIAAIFNGHIHTYLEFPFIIYDATNTSKRIPDYVSGGGGQPPQDIFASIFSADYHWLKVTVTDDGVVVTPMR